jgi:hypothetical protein
MVRRTLQILGILIACIGGSQGQAISEVPSDRESLVPFVTRFCLDCHNTSQKTGGLELESSLKSSPAENLAVWESVIRKLRVRQMPPDNADQPEEATRSQMIRHLEATLDEAARVNPRPGRTESIRRLTRFEYQNAIRDVLALQIDAAALLPADESGHGFDNVTVSDLSPTLLNRYLTAAQKIARLAVGRLGSTPDGNTFRVPADLTQEGHIEGLPLGTRGGVLIPYTFPADGEYDIEVRLTRDRNEEIEGLKRPHEMQILLNRRRVASFTIHPPKDANHSDVDAHLRARIPMTAGRHDLGITFLKSTSSLLETKRQPMNARFNVHRHPRTAPAVYQVTVVGPWNASASGQSESQRRIYGTATRDSDDATAARQILSPLLRQLYRREIHDDDFLVPMKFFAEAIAAESDFDAGIEAALAAMLVNPSFLLRIESDPPQAEPDSVYPICDSELASRLSFFLWSSVPDDELLQLATAKELSRPDVLRGQVLRMLADPRSDALATHFAGQWLYLRNLQSSTPDLRLFPDFDENLRQAMQRETELCFQHILRDNRSVLELLKSDWTYLNERLGKHYGIPHISGSHFRKVTLRPEWHRGGVLRHASVLTVTSYATRTSPVIRGHWILKNLLGAPPPPPPSDVPALKDRTVSASLSVRARLAEHRADPACASCHNQMDPIGFTLENYDAVGRWREIEEELPIDATGTFADGRTLQGVDDLEQQLLDSPEIFIGTLAEKLLTYALGRGVDHNDGAAIRDIVRKTRADGDRFAALVCAITESAAFRMRQTASNPSPSEGN